MIYIITLFSMCMGGPNNIIVPPCEPNLCTGFDTDLDGDVDLKDWAEISNGRLN